MEDPGTNGDESQPGSRAVPHKPNLGGIQDKGNPPKGPLNSRGHPHYVRAALDAHRDKSGPPTSQTRPIDATTHLPAVICFRVQTKAWANNGDTLVVNLAVHVASAHTQEHAARRGRKTTHRFAAEPTLHRMQAQGWLPSTNSEINIDIEVTPPGMRMIVFVYNVALGYLGSALWAGGLLSSPPYSSLSASGGVVSGPSLQGNRRWRPNRTESQCSHGSRLEDTAALASGFRIVGGEVVQLVDRVANLGKRMDAHYLCRHLVVSPGARVGVSWWPWWAGRRGGERCLSNVLAG